MASLKLVADNSYEGSERQKADLKKLLDLERRITQLESLVRLLRSPKQT